MAFRSVPDVLLYPFSRMVDPSGKFEEAQPAAAIPQPPAAAAETATETIAKATEQARAATQQRQKAARRSRSIFSSPLGLAGEASTVKKTLLGQ